ncbi:Extracellular matrix organizing protein FRAS1 (Fraser syndrome 1 protein) [Durusdinium trenchii]|uniref:Extracellular matrix organizing protein FRAS1 (Fraser syndrome 1 protein) n=1 Tax=Durusdinium trenchii TaxID=1381693 RepID=A0ABP0HIA5_9DINO
MLGASMIVAASLQLIGLAQLPVVEGSWCQASSFGSCLGQRHDFEKKDLPRLHGGRYRNLRFADWDGDGDTDVLAGHGPGESIWFHERLSNDSFRSHELGKIPKRWHAESATVAEGDDWLAQQQLAVDEFMKNTFRVEVADWDGNKELDLLLCTMVDDLVIVSVLNRSSLPHENLTEVERVILLTHGSACDMLAVDFDDDGDVDLILGHHAYQPRYSRYFERISSGQLVERTGDQNPLDMFNDTIRTIADLDGDGQLEVMTTGWVDKGYAIQVIHFGYFHRTSDGSFVESAENPLFDLNLWDPDEYATEAHVADWNSDGLPDLLTIHVGRYLPQRSYGLADCYEHVQDRDLVQNSQIDTYRDIKLASFGKSMHPVVVDWNHDGFEDVVVVDYVLGWGEGEIVSKQPKLFEFHGDSVHEVSGFLGEEMVSLAIADWDTDGDLDLIISSTDGKLHYHEMVLGGWQKEDPDHPFKSIVLGQEEGGQKKLVQPLVLDWDNDGDMDLFLGPPDGRYFEQLADGTLHAWPLEQSPVRKVLSLPRFEDRVWRFVDCDADGDFDLIRVLLDDYVPVKACEHDSAHELQCDHDFPCLGTNLSHFNRTAGGPLEHLSLISLDLGLLTDGWLKFITWHFGRGLLMWSAGFCSPADSCHQGGYCFPRKTHCSCSAGRELGDCSGCEPQFYSVPTVIGQMHDCKACPGEGDKVCSGRGSCFDDETAKAAPLESTAASMAKGNGSCSCNEAHFFGSDDEGRSTCVEGVCPAGTEEQDGHCRACAAGSFSPAGGLCKLCFPGTFSLPGSGHCSRCAPGSVSKTSGASGCDACPAGTYEVDHQLCNKCPTGFVSATGQSSCAKCDAGLHAPKAGSILCEPCKAGTYAGEASRKCSACPPGSVSGAAQGACSLCEAGRFARASVTCDQCPAGSWSGAGTIECRSCIPGTFSLTGSSNCSHCLPGSVSTAGALTCDVCPAGKYEVNHQLCSVCPLGTISTGGSDACSQCEAGRFAKSSQTCEPCPGGTFANKGSSSCSSCPVDHVSSPNSAACTSCESLFIRTSPDVMKQSCQVRSMEILLALICWVTSSCFCLLCWTGVLGRIPLSDLSAQGQKLVVTTSVAHFLLDWARPVVTFSGTGVPHLDESTGPWTVQALNLYQVSLQGSTSSSTSLDTSTGHLHLKFPQVLLSVGLWRCPLLWWCILFLAAAAGTATQLTWQLTLLVCGLGFGTGSLCMVLRRRQGKRTPLATRRRHFLKEWPLVLERCSRGEERAMTAGTLLDFVQFFESFIRERSMYYVCSNIVKPLTEPYQLSLVELVGPTMIQWFVSHYWGMPVRHFSDAIRKHAQSYHGDWRDAAYWICTFSNSQWHVKEELGHGRWQDSSFYLALRSPECKGTTMIIDELVLPLQRIWCLFEVYQTICLTRSSHFHGLLLCTSSGVLQQGKAGTDVAVAVAQTVATLDTRSAVASAEEDRQMIHSLIEQMPGGFDTMNTFVCDTICNALEASHLHYESTLKNLMQNLRLRVAPTSSVSSPPVAFLPTLLTSGASSAKLPASKEGKEGTS